MGKVDSFLASWEIIRERYLKEAIRALVIREVVLDIGDIAASSNPLGVFVPLHVQDQHSHAHLEKTLWFV